MITAYAFDLEANGFKPTEIFCIGVTNLLTTERLMFDRDTIAEGCMLLKDADIIVGHYIRGYDCPVIERLTKGMITFDNNKMIDTLDMSKAMTKNPKHSLAFWGDYFGIPKFESPLFESYNPVMLPYCERDVEITVRLFYHLLEKYIDDGTEFRNHEALGLFIQELTNSSKLLV